MIIGAGQDYNPEAVQENTGLLDFEDVEEAFTFCNLSSNNFDSAHRDNFSFDHQDHFGFFSDASTAHSSDSIIFCGKLIPYKGEKVVADQTAQKYQEITDKSKLTGKSSISPSKLSHSSSKSTERAAERSNASPKKKKQEKSDREDCGSTDKGHGGRKLSVDKYDSSMRKGSDLPPLMKSVSHSIRSGAAKFAMEIGLISDLKTRQSKRSSTPAMFSSANESDKKDRRSKEKREKKNLRGSCRGEASVDCISYF